MNDLNILFCQFLGADKVCDGDPLLVHRVEVLNVVVKEVVRAGEWGKLSMSIVHFNIPEV